MFAVAVLVVAVRRLHEESRLPDLDFGGLDCLTRAGSHVQGGGRPKKYGCVPLHP